VKTENVLTLLKKVGTPDDVLNKMRLDILSDGVEPVLEGFLEKLNHDEIKKLCSSIRTSYRGTVNFIPIIITMLKNFSSAYPDLDMRVLIEKTERARDKKEFLKELREVMNLPLQDKAKNDAARRKFLSEHFANIMNEE